MITARARARLRRRAPHIPVVLYPSPVQGEGAADTLAALRHCKPSKVSMLKTAISVAPQQTSLSAQTRQQLASALSADSGLLLGAVASKQVLTRDGFKSTADSVALSSVTAQFAADDARAPRLAAFAQPMRFERQES